MLDKRIEKWYDGGIEDTNPGLGSARSGSLWNSVVSVIVKGSRLFCTAKQRRLTNAKDSLPTSENPIFRLVVRRAVL